MKVIEVQDAVLGITRIPDEKRPWRLTLQDPSSKEVYWVGLTQEVVDEIVQKFTGGIVIPRAKL
jgi:hypothetical protein